MTKDTMDIMCKTKARGQGICYEGEQRGKPCPLQYIPLNASLDECPLKCSEVSKNEDFPGCCERRRSGECFWTRAKGAPFLAYEQRKEHGKPEDTRSVLCSSGNFWNITFLWSYYLIYMSTNQGLIKLVQ